jgi:hypothetical protein
MPPPKFESKERYFPLMVDGASSPPATTDEVDMLYRQLTEIHAIDAA